jgi:glycosyltransferase involved in cell wall biosynthesis
MVESSENNYQKTALWVVPVGDIGGVARHVLDAATTTIPGWRIVVLAPEGPFVDRCSRSAVPVIVAEIGPEYGLRTSVATLRRTIDRLKPDLVHTHLAYADIVAAATCPWRRGPVLVSTEHGISGDERLYQGASLHSKAMKMAHHIRLHAFDGIIAVSESTAEQIRRRWNPPARLPIHMIRNGVDPVAELGARPPGLRISTISRLSPEKRLDATVEGFAELLRSQPTATLTIAGVGSELADLRLACARLGVDHAVDFVGFVDPRDVLGRTDVLAQLSAWENCSYTLLDAIAAGTGVVASPVGGNAELLPTNCLVSANQAGSIAARLVEQGLHPGKRPTLPLGWPNKVDMNLSISQFYERVAR